MSRLIGCGMRFRGDSSSATLRKGGAARLWQQEGLRSTSGWRIVLDRILAIARDAGPSRAHDQIRAFRRVILLYGAARSWLWTSVPHSVSVFDVIVAVGLTICLLLSLRKETEIWSVRLALPFVLLLVVVSFPTTPNHYYLELLALILLSTIDGEGMEEQEKTVLAALRWVAAIVLFQTGLQKILYGLYFRGDIFAFLIGQDPRFATLFEHIVAPEEVARLASYDSLRTGAGPYRLDSLPVVAASNLTYAVELVLPPLMMLRATRRWAAWAAVAFVLLIQLGAREAGFAVVFSSLLLLFQPNAPLRRALPALAVVFALAIAAAHGLLPGGAWIRSINP
jgi:hypothetical protein